MKNLFKILLFGTLLITNFSCAQTTIMKTISDAKNIENNKKEFIGKSLTYFLNHINMEIISIIPTPNKTPNQINSLSFLFVKYNDYKKDFYNNKLNTKITVRFNQNPNLIGEKCTSKILDCTQWTKDDEKNIGKLIVHDIYVTGKD